MNLQSEIEKTLQSVFPELLDFPWLPLNPVVENLPQANSLFAKPRETKEELSTCTKCSLFLGRTKPVQPRGMLESKILFVGDVPSDDDDRAGFALSGASGELLDKMILAMKLQPSDVCIANLTHCRPPQKMEISEKEFLVCTSQYTEAEFRRVPRLAIFALGERSAQFFSQSKSHLSALRGQTLHWNHIRVFATLHPRELVAFPDKKKDAWNDLKNAIRFLGNN